MSEDATASTPPPTPVFLAEVDVKTVDKALAGMIMSIRILDTRIAASAMTGAQVIDEIAEMFPPAELFGPDIRAYPIVYKSLREWLASKGATLPRHRSGRAIMQLSNLYADAEMKNAAEALATRIYNAGKRVAPVESEHASSSDSRPSGGDGFAAHKIAHQMNMRFKDSATKFSGELGECWMDFVAEYQQVARDYGLTAAQKKQYLHNLLRGDAKRFYLDRIDNVVPLYSEAVRLIDEEYNSIVRQNRVKNFLSALRLSTYTKDGLDVLAALEKVYKVITKLSAQVPISHRGETHRIEFLRNATVGYDWATQPLSRVATHSLTFQQLYGELEFQLHLSREAKVANIRDKLSRGASSTETEATVPGILYQGPGHYARRHKGVGDTRRAASGGPTSAGYKKLDPLLIMGCFNCDDPGHMVSRCPKPIDSTRAAKRRMEYLAKKTGERRNAHVVLFELCQQLDAAAQAAPEEPPVSDAEVHVNETEEDVGDFDLFDALVNYVEGEETVEEVPTLDVASDFGILYQDADEVFELGKDLKIYHQSRHPALGETQFHGACLDTGAQRSVIGKSQALAYYRYMGIPLALSRSNPKVYKFGSQRKISSGKAKFRIPYAGKRQMHVELDVIDIDIPMLLGLDLLDKFNLVVDNIDNMLYCKTHKWKAPIARKFGHLYYEWPYELMYTVPELKKIHRHFYHPEPLRLFNVMKQAKDPHATQETLEKLEKITSACDICQRLSKEPGRFRVALPNSDVVFNRCVLIDLMSLESSTVLHMVCKDTLFSVAVFMNGDSAKDTWDAYLRYWVHAYVGYSKAIHADRGPQFNSDEWRHLLQSAGIERRDSGVESHNALGAGEKYHDFLRRIFTKVRREHPILPKDNCLSLAVHAMNNTAGPCGLVPTLLVFGIVPPLPLGFSDLPEQRARMEALHKARREMSKAVATARLRTALSRNVPAAADRDIRIGSRVLCYKEKAKEWEGPYTVVAGDGKQLWLNIKDELKLISVDKLRPYVPPLPENTPPVSEAQENSEGDHAPALPRSSLPWISREDAAPDDAIFERAINGESFLAKAYDVLHSVRKSTEGNSPVIETPSPVLLVERVPQSDPRARSPRFDDAKTAEVEGLQRRKAWTVVDETNLPVDANIIGARFDLTLKNFGTEHEKAKARFIGQGYKDKMKDFIVHNSPTLRQSSTRLILSTAAVLNYRIAMIDFVQAYLQSKEKLDRQIFLKLRDEDRHFFKLKPGQYLHLQKPLYGICDSGDYWGATFESYIRTELRMVSLDGDPSLYMLNGDADPVGLLGAYVDDNLFAGSSEFEASITRTAARFESKPVERDNVEFVGVKIRTTKHSNGDRSFLATQPEYCQTLHVLPQGISYEKFRSVRSALSWLTHTRPDICCAVNRAMQVTEDLFSDKAVKEINEAIAYTKGTPEVKLRYTPMNRDSLHLRAYADASFASNLDLSSQLGFIILLCDEEDNSHVLNFCSRKSRRKVRSIMAAETYAFTAAFDFAYIIKHDLERILRQPIPLKMFTDSKQLFDVITRASHTTEKRLMIDVASAREAYNNFEISNVGLVSGTVNPADGLTKPRICKPLYDVISTGVDSTPVVQWIIRKE